MKQVPKHKIDRYRLSYIAHAAVVASLACSFSARSQTTLNIAPSPLTVISASHPKILFAVGNSQSMDGDLSGAIRVGSGSAATGPAYYNSSSPLNYTVPTGFIPPAQAAVAGSAPYTVTQSGNLVDNGPSRLNVAKAGITGILQSYMTNADFALATYNTSGVNLYTTWVYYMSPASGPFVFTSTQTAGNVYVANPCLNYSTAVSATLKSNCTSIVNSGLWGNAATIGGSLYLQVSVTSDDPKINDVLYASGIPGVSIVYGGASPATPYPPNFTLLQYENGGVLERYPSSVPASATATGPTNAGYVPYTNQVMYVQRGFGYYGSQSSNTGNVVVPMTSAGTNPTTASINSALAAFAPFLKPETNSTGTGEIKAAAIQSPTAGLLAKAQSYLSGVSSSFGGCPQSKYTILISDGLPTEDLAGHAWPPLGSAAANGYGVTATFNANGSLNTTNDQALTDTITNLTNLNNAGVKTFVIGLGAGVDPSVNPSAAATLQAMAIAGGTGNYFPASSPAALINDLNNILLSILTGDLSTTSAAVNASRLINGTVEYQTLFTARDTPYLDWTGDLYERALNPVTGAPTGSILWSAQTMLDTQAAADNGSGVAPNRVITTWNPTSNTAVPFQWANLSATQQTALQPLDALGSNRLQYLRGNKTSEVQNGGAFRNRSHILGDITDSQPVYVGAPYSFFPGSTSYLAYVSSNANRQPMLYAGANDGMLHAFNATTGNEQFAFIPNGVFSNLINLTQTTYNQNHQYFVNGSPQVGDVQFSNGSWHTILAAGLSGGGRSVYALDVTNPTSLTTETALASSVLWEFTEADLGLTYSEPQFAPISASPNFAVFFGNGYNSTNNKAILYALNPQTGALIAKIDLCAAVSSACSTTAPQGLSTVAVGNSNGLQGQAITQIYAGDLQGNLWAIDVSSSSPSSWGVRLLLQARDSSGAPQPITTQPQVTLNPNFTGLLGNFIMFGTGQLLTNSDLGNTQTQTIYGVWDKPGSSSTLARSNLVSQSLSLSSNLLTITGNTIDWSTKYGWYVDLFSPGLRVVTDPQLLNGALLTTLNAPPASTCGANYTSYFLELNFKNGGSFGQPRINVNGAFLTGNNTVGFGLGSGYASAPTIVGVNSSNLIESLVTQSGGTQTPILNTNTTPRRIGWWQVQ